MRALEEEFKQGMEVCCKKNKDYGNAKDKFGEVMAILFPQGITLSLKDTTNEFAIFTEILKKVMRFSNLWLKEDQKNFESIEDTLMDLGNYAFILKNMIHNNKKEVAK